MSIRFDGRVAIVTGAGQGLGRSHALGLAERGARVMVNDLGGGRDGTGSSAAPAAVVAEEIRAAGGEALASGADVSRRDEVEAMVAQAMAAWGRVDILVANAGILRDKTFLKMDLEDFRAVLEVHLMGSVHCLKAVWEAMRQQSYGRVVLTTSSSGLYGNFGQSNYGAAKMALVGLMNTLVLEGAKYDIRVNCLAPSAESRMTADLMRSGQLEQLAPEAVTVGLLALVCEDAPNRTVLAAGAGTYARAVIAETHGLYLPSERRTPEAVLAGWQEICDTTDQMEFTSGSEQPRAFLRRATAGDERTTNG